MARHCLLQVVDVIGKNAVQLAHFRRHVARHRDVDEEHRTILAAGKELFTMLAPEDGVRCARRSDDDVGAVAGGVKVFELDGLSVELLRQPDCAVISAVSYKD